MHYQAKVCKIGRRFFIFRRVSSSFKFKIKSCRTKKAEARRSKKLPERKRLLSLRKLKLQKLPKVSLTINKLMQYLSLAASATLMLCTGIGIDQNIYHNTKFFLFTISSISWFMVIFNLYVGGW